MKTAREKSLLFRLLLKPYRFCRKTGWRLVELRLKWGRRSFYLSLDIWELIVVTHNMSPFAKTMELDAAIFAFQGELEQLEDCLRRGVSPDLRGLLELAIFKGQVLVAESLLAHGADPNRTVDGVGNTLLHDATQRGQPAIVAALLANGADPNRTTREGVKPFDCACQRRDEGARPWSSC